MSEFQPRQLRPDERVRADFIEFAKSIPRPDALTLRELYDVSQAIREAADDMDKMYTEYIAEVRIRESAGQVAVKAAGVERPAEELPTNE